MPLLRRPIALVKRPSPFVRLLRTALTSAVAAGLFILTLSIVVLVVTD